jgi:subtilisin family serine protease
LRRFSIIARRSLFLAVATWLLVVGSAVRAGSLAPNLKDELISAGPDDLIPIVVLMEEFPGREKLLSEVRGLSREARRREVVSRLQSLAERSQRPVHDALSRESADIRDVRTLWGINGVALEATPRVIERLADLPEVRWVLHDHGAPHPGSEDDQAPTMIELSTPGSGTRAGRPTFDHAEGSGPTGGDVSGPNPDATVAGEVVAMGAQQVWNHLGYTGAGVIVAVIDTGVDPTHPDLADHMWTNLGEVPNNGLDDDGNGYIDDRWGWDFCADTLPVIDSHGTQVAGQVAGDGTGGTVTGMAPDAELMSLGIDCDTPSASWEASDYAIAHGAHIITQSYSWWWTDQPDYEAFRRQTDVELAAGVIHANSAGNSATNLDRPVPYNISTPANCPAPWIHPDQTLVGGLSSTIAIGNISWSTDLIDSSSSLGPAAWEDIQANTDPDFPHPTAPEYQDYPHENGAQMGLIKPDLSAYGTGTTATCPGPYYCGFSGTSSATPHVSGTLALMLQANPAATPEQLAEAVMTTAEHRGDPGKNNVYGTGLLQAYAAVLAVESGVIYDSHVIDDSAWGNGDLRLDPGERVELQVTVESRTDGTIDGLEAVLSTTTPGVTIHDHHTTYPPLAARGLAVNDAPNFSLSIDPGACSSVAHFDLEMRSGGASWRSTFHVRVGDLRTDPLLSDDFESDGGWTADPGTASDGFWVRENPNGKQDAQSRLTNPEDDSSDPGDTCWVTGNASGGNADGDDVDDGRVILLSPAFGEPHILSLELNYDRWFYDNQSSANTMWIEFSNDGGASWANVETIVYGYGGWQTKTVDLLGLLPSSDDMRLRVVVEDGGVDGTVEGAVDEVHVTGDWVACERFVPPAMQAPNPIGDTLSIEVDARGHTVLTWNAPPVDAGHDAATLFRVERSTSPSGPFVEAGSATLPRWVDVDALGANESFYYRVWAENTGGSE